MQPNLPEVLVLLGLSAGAPPLQHIYFLVFLVGMALLLHVYRPTALGPPGKPDSRHLVSTRCGAKG